MKIFIVNDTTKIKRDGQCVQHFGCEITMKTYHEQLKRIGASIVGTSGREKNPKIPKNIDLVIVNGEGSIHHGHHSHFLKIATKYPAVLLNAVWEKNPQYSFLKHFKLIAVRESFSHKQLPNSIIVPDLVFASNILKNFKKPEPRKDLGKTDNVVNKNSGFSIHCPINKYLTLLSTYKRICAGRFHAAVAAAVLQIPFNVWKSNTHKMQALVDDMNVPQLYYNKQEEALRNVPETFDSQITTYVNQSQTTIERMFDNLPNL